MSANALQLSQLLNITLRNGDAMLMAGRSRATGLKSGDPDSFKSFDDLKEALYKQADYFIGRIVEGSNLRDRFSPKELPAPMLSPFIDGCMENRKDVTRAARATSSRGSRMINAIANLIDSLLVIKKLVYEQKRLSVKEFVQALDDGFNGHEIEAEIDAIPASGATGDAETDALPRRSWAGCSR